MEPKNEFADVKKKKDIKIPKGLHISKILYLRPILVKYGPLTNLTAGGTAIDAENIQGQPPKKQRP